MTEGKMRVFCKEVVPEIEKIKEIMVNHGIETSIYVTINIGNNLISLIGNVEEFDGWDLTKFDDDPYEIWHRGEAMKLDKE